jgi:hypothetical protein
LDCTASRTFFILRLFFSACALVISTSAALAAAWARGFEIAARRAGVLALLRYSSGFNALPSHEQNAKDE